MEIKVLGTGCTGCKLLFENVKTAIFELGVDANVVKEEDLAKIIDYNVLSLPAIVVDGKVISSGKKLTVSEVKLLLNQEETSCPCGANYFCKCE